MCQRRNLLAEDPLGAVAAEGKSNEAASSIRKSDLLLLRVEVIALTVVSSAPQRLLYLMTSLGCSQRHKKMAF